MEKRKFTRCLNFTYIRNIYIYYKKVWGWLCIRVKMHIGEMYCESRKKVACNRIVPLVIKNGRNAKTYSNNARSVWQNVNLAFHFNLGGYPEKATIDERQFPNGRSFFAKPDFSCIYFWQSGENAEKIQNGKFY